MLGMLILALADLAMLCDSVDIVAAMSVEALLGADTVFTAELHDPLRPHPGQAVSAARVSAPKDSPLVASHLHDDDCVQDAYSLRCAPQVAGAVRDRLRQVVAKS